MHVLKFQAFSSILFCIFVSTVKIDLFLVLDKENWFLLGSSLVVLMLEFKYFSFK